MATITGTSGPDDLSSSTAGDVILGLGGEDTLSATAAGITLDGGSDNDQLFSSGGATLIGGSGDDILSSTGANDTASYANDPSNDPAGVVVDLSTADADGIVYVIDGTGGTDTLIGIENVTGSAFIDTLTGDDFANVLQGGAGNDTLEGGGGADVFKYSFDLKQGGETFSFTEFFAEHGGSVVNGEVADGTSQGQFSSLYTQWLESLGLKVLDLGQNSGFDGMPVVEGPDGTFGERESFMAKTGKTSHERFYSDSFSTGEGEDTVASTDGFDTILDFTWGVDQLEFDGLAGLTLDQFTGLFSVTETDVDGIGGTDTVLALADGTWGVTLLNESGHTEADFYGSSIFS